MHEEKLVVLSTGHISEQDNNALVLLDHQNEHYRVLWAREYGFMMHVDLMRGIAANLEPRLDSLERVLQYARVHGADWLLLDRDGAGTKELPIYDW